MRPTRLKLQEAAFFLQKVDEHYVNIAHFGPGGSRELFYYVSAFVSAARSVPWIMRSEYGAVDGWRAWFSIKRPEGEGQALLSKFVAIRNRSLKSEPLVGESLVRLTREDIPELGPIDPKLKHYRVRIVAAGPTPEVPPAITARFGSIEWHLPELGEEDLLRACNRYFALLDELVRDCEARFGSSPDNPRVEKSP